MKFCECGRPIIFDSEAIEQEEKLIKIFGYENIGEDYDVEVYFDVKIRPKKFPLKASEHIMHQNIESRLKYKMKTLAVYLEEVIRGGLKNRIRPKI